MASLTFDGRAVWFHSVDSLDRVAMSFDYIEAMIAADGYLDPPPALAPFTFDFYDWEARQPELVRGS